ncbi:MAG: PSD1 and planctomycete cytochrome C domain-containing protein [Verrucomicrobiales bacterium]
MLLRSYGKILADSGGLKIVRDAALLYLMARILRYVGLFGSLGLGVAMQAGEIDFARDVQPIFIKNCTECHGGVKQAGGVSFIYHDQVLGEGESGNRIVVPGDPEKSEMIYRITTEDKDDFMPPAGDHPPLKPEEIAVLKQWVSEGAEWGGHWAFQKPEKSELPAVKDPKWAQVDLDRYVLARLEGEAISPAPDAANKLWLRRASLDVIGLPPTVEELNAFDGNREAALDRLLASPKYGERWAAVWLDQLRYADSKGLGQDGKRTVWKYRDWVIDAFNSDMGYDDFTVKQIAGDLLPNASIGDVLATTCHRLTQTNEEGGTDDEEFRIEAVLDRVSTTWQTWQGITFGCVQCHSHPYDPIKHDEFYKFAAFFNNTSDVDLNEEYPLLKVPIEKSEYEKAAALDAKIKALEASIWETEFATLGKADVWKPLRDMVVKSDSITKFKTEVHGESEHFLTEGTVTRGVTAIVEAPLPDGVKTLTAIRFVGMPADLEKGKIDSEWGFMISSIDLSVIPAGDSPRRQKINLALVVGDEPHPFHDPNATLNPKDVKGVGPYTRIHYPREAAFILEKPIDMPAGAKIEIRLTQKGMALGAFPLVAKRGHLALTDDPAFTALLTDEALAASRKKLNELEKARAQVKSVAIPVLNERPENLMRPQHVFIRGLFLTKDQEVKPGVPESLPPMPEGVSNDRLGLAKWMVSPENPLIARVMVNRVWAQLFGVGLVATEEDFGSSGEKPSHPALLDYLAVQFQTEWDWSVKRLIREVLLSRTYGQNNAIRPGLQERDASNSLLARGPRHRISAETIRDSALYISGLLSDKMHGAPVHPPIPEGVWRPFQGGDKWDTPKPDSLDRYRRSIYTYTKRSIPYPMFAAFDAPSREFCAPRRLRSNTPIQALMTLNDETFIDASAAFAKKIEAHDGDDAARITFGFQAVTSRLPNEKETARLLELKAVTSWPDVATVLLNLDEGFNK